MTNSLGELSIYIHWPFCKTKCPYCDFNSHESSKIDYDQWSHAYIKEIDFNKDLIKGKKINSIFFGGGTPSLMNPKIVKAILEKINYLAIISDNTEITLEANPNSIDRDRFLDFKSAGINRISIGIQSLRTKNLKFLGRSHSNQDGLKAIELAKDIFNNYSFDLIYCLPNQSIEEWENELNAAIKYVDYHISCYQLTIEKGTQFYNDFKSNVFSMATENTSAQMYEFTCNMLESKGMIQYEISNFSKPEYKCKHNMGYWLLKDYIGLGPGAHGRYQFNNEIYSTINYYSPTKWIEYLVIRNQKPIQSKKKLSNNEQLIDTLNMGLRLNRGLHISKIPNKDHLKQLTKHGLIKNIKNDYITCTLKGRLLLNTVIEILLNDTY